ncbi:MAG: hypothetical protein JSS62_00970 [Verrucomicrobia bacterium]|nr:hypothetical protein [Verrucomicrobiota bacterium]MBS0645259.1 hypothetical protein [Verrucomicrobiota bacterium]
MSKYWKFLFWVSVSLFPICLPLTPGFGGIEAEFIYFKPSMPQGTYFVISNGQELNNDLTFYPGFRVGLSCCLPSCESQFSATYTYLNASQQRNVFGNNLKVDLLTVPIFTDTDFQVYSGSAGSNVKTLYQRLDLIFSMPLICNCCLDTFVEGGLELDAMRSQEVYTFIKTSGVSSTGNASVNFNNYLVGPVGGLKFNYLLPEFCSIYKSKICFVGYAGGGLLSTYVSAAQGASQNTRTQLSATAESLWSTSLALHTQLGIKIVKQFLPRVCADLEIGYEYSDYFLNIQGTLQYGLQGLYVGGNIYF